MNKDGERSKSLGAGPRPTVLAGYIECGNKGYCKELETRTLLQNGLGHCPCESIAVHYRKGSQFLKLWVGLERSQG